MMQTHLGTQALSVYFHEIHICKLHKVLNRSIFLQLVCRTVGRDLRLASSPVSGRAISHSLPFCQASDQTLVETGRQTVQSQFLPVMCICKFDLKKLTLVLDMVYKHHRLRHDFLSCFYILYM